MNNEITGQYSNPFTRWFSLIVVSLLLLSGSGCVELEKAVRHYEQGSANGPLDARTVAAGLKEALKVGTQRTVDTTSIVDGYLGNTLIRIAMPEEFHTMTSTLNRVGLGRYVEEMEIAMALLGRTMQRTTQRLQQEMSEGVRDTLNDSFRQSFGKTLNQIPYLNPSNDDEEHSGISIPPRDDLHRTLGVALPGERT